MNYVIRWSFYLLFFLVPLIFTSINSELFEFNKMMLTYSLTIIIVAAWLIKMVLTQKIIYRRTFLEIPLLLYFFSHLLSTIFSIDPHTSIWGYYSRFHEGLLATISYILLYFAAVSNLDKNDVKNIFYSSFAAGIIVAIWGILEHFGMSISCLVFTGKFDVACWIQDVKNRVYATLGQPNWMAAYLDILILIALSFKNKISLLSVPFFAALLFTKSRSGILGLIFGGAIFFAILFIKERAKIFTNKFLIISVILILFSSFIFSSPFTQTTSKTQSLEPSPYIDIGISQSSDIRKIVWEGAVKVWQRYPLFGSGVETFAFAYYKDRPVAHNMVSEWDFLYNKAHNEYLNLLATTGSVGFLAYLGVILTFVIWSIYNLQFTIFNKFPIALFTAWISILVTNFFGFSVVIIGLYFFLIPAFCAILKDD